MSGPVTFMRQFTPYTGRERDTKRQGRKEIQRHIVAERERVRQAHTHTYILVCG